VGGLVAVALLSGGTYLRQRNEIVRKDEQVRQAWSQVDVQLQRRADLIPNLVATTRGYARHEAAVFESVAAARAALLGAGTPADRMAANAQLDGALGRLLALAAGYPELKASENFLGLQAQLEGTENRIAVARLRYNASLQDYNAYIKLFPTVLVARASGFQRNRAYFDAARGAARTPRTDVPLGAEHRAPAP
jgi:LemA protein